MIPEVHTPISYKDVLTACKLSIVENDENIIRSFEKDFAQYIGVSYAKSFSSGRGALYAILKVLELKPGDKIIIPAYTSPIIPSLLLKYGVKPVFADVDINSFNIKTEELAKLIDNKTKAMIPVHLFGNPCKIDEIVDIASENNIVVIEDSAQALGAEYWNEKVGKFGDIGLFSFGFGKNMNTMGGGAIVTQRKDLIEKIETTLQFSHISLFQHLKIITMMFLYPVVMSPRIYEIVFRLWNLIRETHTFSEKQVFVKYSKLQAVLGKFELKKIDNFNEKRIKNAKRIIDEIKDLEWLSVQKSEKSAKPVFLRLVVKHEGGRLARDHLKKELIKRGFDVPTLDDYYLATYLNYGTYSQEVHRMFARIKRDIVDRVLALPTNPSLSDQDIETLISVLKASRCE
jgi:perosamine synthetase